MPPIVVVRFIRTPRQFQPSHPHSSMDQIKGEAPALMLLRYPPTQAKTHNQCQPLMFVGDMLNHFIFCLFVTGYSSKYKYILPRLPGIYLCTNFIKKLSCIYVWERFDNLSTKCRTPGNFHSAKCPFGEMSFGEVS